MHRTFLTALLIVLAAGNCFAQGEATSPDSGVPTGVILLPGYTHEFLPTIDTTAGRISREDGLAITYSLDKYRRVSAAPELIGNVIWSKRQQQDDRQLFVTLDPESVLRVRFVYANEGFRPRNGAPMDFVADFYGSVRNSEDIAEFLVMVLGYTR